MTSSSAEQLLAQRVWLRRLAVAIVGDSQADDIIQQTVAAALASPPRDANRLPGWLARAARNFAWKHMLGESAGFLFSTDVWQTRGARGALM